MRRVHAVMSLICAAALLLSALPRGEAAVTATFDVVISTDAPNVNPAGTTCASTLAGNPCTLRAAVQAANNVGGANTINLPAGTYNLTVTGANENAAATGDLDLTSSITIVGAGSGSTVIDGQASDRIFDVVAGVVVSISGVTVRNGNVTTTTFTVGGGIANNGNLTLTDVATNGNTAFQGAGILNNAGASLTLNGAAILGNTIAAGGTNGGGILNNGTVSANFLTVSGNSAVNQGGGILNSNGGIMMLTNTTVSGNTTQTNSTFSSAGAGIMNTNSANLTLNGVTISGNNALTGTSNGGGLYNSDSQTTLTNVTISQNTAATGGGMIVVSGTANLKNVTIAFNSTTGGSGNGGGLFNSGTIFLKNVLLASNSEAGIGRNCGGIAPSSQGNNLDSGNTCSLSLQLSDRINANPGIGPLTTNGGPTLTHALMAGSLAIDGGGACPPPTTDQRGAPRVAPCDIGAYEFGSTVPTAVPTVTPVATNTPVPTATSVPTATPTPTFIPCPTRPTVNVSVVPSSATQLQATIAVNGAVGVPSNQIRGLEIGTATNALLDFPAGPTGVSSNTPVPLPPGTTTITFTVRRVSAGAAATVALTVVDNCGRWPTLVGGGVNAFAAGDAAPAGQPARGATPAATPTPIRLPAPPRP
jgi:hypothetical protein